jgi:hypothetical protein
MLGFKRGEDAASVWVQSDRRLSGAKGSRIPISTG